MEYIGKIYGRILDKTAGFGAYHKCLFHLHTPASGDDYATLEKYRMNQGEEIGKGRKKITHNNLIKLCKENMPQIDNFDVFVNNIFEANKELYKDIDEMLKYLLIAWELTANKIELAVISDHNVVSGFDPLNRAIYIICEKFKDVIKQREYVSPYLVLGIEISCADKNHVVGLFDENAYESIKKFIEEYVMSSKDGTYLTSSDVIKKISDMGGIAYLAHTDTSEMFRGHYLSNAYTKKLLNLPELNAIGFSFATKDKENSRNRVKNYIREKTEKEFAYLLDADSHSIDTIKDRCFYIKGKKCRFTMIKEAILDNDIAISFDVPREPESYIKGIYASNKSSKGFLISKEEGREYFSLSFSGSLNCIIGGRGTGKSTVLNAIEAALGQNFLDENVFNAICEYDEIWILYLYKGKEYLIGFMPRSPKYSGDSAYNEYKRICCEENFFQWKHYDSKDNLKRLKPQILKDCIQVFEIIDSNKVKEINKSVIKQFYDMSYSVNELVKTASGKEINDYIYRTMEMNPAFKIRRNRVYDEASLKRFLNTCDKQMETRRGEILRELERFNNSKYALNKIRLTYEMDDKNYDCFELGDFFDIYREVDKVKGTKYVNGTNLSIEGVIGFLYELKQKCGNINFAKKILDKSLVTENSMLLTFTTPITAEMAEMNLTELNEVTAVEVLKKINQYILDEKIDNIIKTFGDDYIRNTEVFGLKFNVMNKEGGCKRELYRDVRQLSLGQKVVAMLLFVLGYGDYTNDCRPLIIDQPEDNLDNQYIFKNLVDSLRKIRENRQVIIATHNATIVTNAKAEQVVVMESDGEHGWVTDKGYVTEKRIKQHIVNYMEGGEASFRHKINVYKDIIQ
ncbi:MAG: hypothetical protein E7198_07950 [Schwartzia succinivorans]|uniref:Spaf_1101 family AAA-like ATPase n=1 Tax=Schwartzia succinivorans TaxID=55507 RepID=UPI002356A4A2|nr:AAA family ATPase [Schwartzia succinivorans]MBE6097714.1 hypothetical protein [Schwartzia succinivorans]